MSATGCTVRQSLTGAALADDDAADPADGGEDVEEDVEEEAAAGNVVHAGAAPDDVVVAPDDTAAKLAALATPAPTTPRPTAPRVSAPRPIAPSPALPSPAAPSRTTLSRTRPSRVAPGPAGLVVLLLVVPPVTVPPLAVLPLVVLPLDGSHVTTGDGVARKGEWVYPVQVTGGLRCPDLSGRADSWPLDAPPGRAVPGRTLRRGGEARMMAACPSGRDRGEARGLEWRAGRGRAPGTCWWSRTTRATC